MSRATDRFGQWSKRVAGRAAQRRPPTDPPDGDARRCRRVRGWLPAHAAGALGGWRARLVDRHLARCGSCRAEADRERTVTAGLEQLETAVAETPADPPPELLDELLAQAHHPGWRARAAVPARGAVSGARPGWSVVLGAVTLALAVATGYGAWRAWGAWRRGRGAGGGQ